MVLNRYDKTVNTHAYSTHVIRLHNTMPSHTQAQTHRHTLIIHIMSISIYPDMDEDIGTRDGMVWHGKAP